MATLPDFGLMGTMLREWTTWGGIDRVPEPELVMNDPEQVSAYIRASRIEGIMAPTYLFHAAHACEVIRPGDTVLDLACGPATQLGLVAQLNPRSQFIGVDLSDEMLGRASSHIEELGLSNVELRHGDMTSLASFGDASVDTAISTMSLHHLPSRADLCSTFRTAARVVRSGGGLYLADFGRLKSDASIRYFAYNHAERQPVLFTEDYLRSLRAAFQPSDFRELSRRHFGHRAQVHCTLGMPFMMAVKTPSEARADEGALRLCLRDLARRLPAPQQRDLNDLTRLFGLGGLRSALLK